jgi:class 3 adenylate cyclase/alpha-beta hydrolase superfamily lysophospholipase
MTQAPETRYARAADGIHVGYQVVGSGPVDLVFVPYDYSNIEAAWDFPPFVSFVRGLASIGRVLVFDRRGSGTSDRSWTGEAATIEAQMDDIRAVMDAASSERAFLFGIESGASLCFTFAATHPHRTSGVIVQAPMVRGTPAPDYPASWSREMYEEYFERVEHAWGTDAFVREVVETLSPSLLHDETTVRAYGRQLRLSASPGDAIARDRAVMETDVRHILPSVQAPTLVLHRTGDRMTKVDEGRYTAEHTPGARIVELPGDDHLYPLDDLVPHIAAFVESLRVEQADFDRVLATVLFTDVVDSTAQAAALGDGGWRDVRARHDQIVRSQIARYRGREIKTMGDGFLATFDGPARGVRCAMAVAAAVGPLGIEIRAGLHTGEVAIEGDDVAGLGVVIGARVGALAGPSQVLVSQTVKDLVAGSGLSFEDAGEHELKGVPDRWRLYRVVDR